MGSKKKHNKQEEQPRRSTWLIAAVVAAVAAVVATRSRSNPFRDLDDAERMDVALRAVARQIFG